jgi:hypothetical protein
MYEPFPGNSVWSLSVNICIFMGCAIGESIPLTSESATSQNRATMPARKHSLRMDEHG